MSETRLATTRSFPSMCRNGVLSHLLCLFFLVFTKDALGKGSFKDMFLPSLAGIEEIYRRMRVKRGNAGVIWVTFDNRGDFKRAPGLAEQYLCNSNFRISKENISRVSVAATLTGPLQGFEKHVSDAFNRIKESDDPQLVLYVDAHGGNGYICQQAIWKNRTYIAHEEFLTVVTRQIDKFREATGRDPIVFILYDACNAASLIDTAKYQLASPPEDGSAPRFTNGGPRKYYYKIVIIASSDTDKLSYGNELAFALPSDVENHHRPTSNRRRPTAPVPNFVKLCNGDRKNTINYWNSFYPLLANDALEAFLNLRGEQAADALRTLQHTEMPAIPPEELPTLQKRLKARAKEALRTLLHSKGEDAVGALKVLKYTGMPPIPEDQYSVVLKLLGTVGSEAEFGVFPLKHMLLAQPENPEVSEALMKVFWRGDLETKLSVAQALSLGQTFPEKSLPLLNAFFENRFNTPHEHNLMKAIRILFTYVLGPPTRGPITSLAGKKENSVSQSEEPYK